MGLGKTVSTLTAAVALFDRFEAGRMLVISRKRVIRQTWPMEIQKWQHTHGLRFHHLNGAIRREIVTKNPDGTPRRKPLHKYHVDKAKLLVDADVYLISQEYVPHLATTWGQKWPYDVVVLDDMKGLKRASSAYFRKLRSISNRTDYLVELTGTPAPNGLLQIWPQIYLLDNGERLGRTFTQYRDKYFYPDHAGIRWTPREGAAEEIYAKVADICFSLAAEDYLDLGPEPIINDIWIDFPPDLRAQYRELEKEFLIEIDGREIVADNAGVLTGKLQQFCNGAIYTGPKEWVEIHRLKLDALEEVFDEANGNPILLAWNFKHDAERIRRRLPIATSVDAFDFFRRWDRGEIPLAITHPDSAGHGLNFQFGGHTAAWFGLTWNLEHYDQFNARLGQVRQAQAGFNRPAIYHRILIRDTIDETMARESLPGKDRDQRSLLNAVKRDIKARL